MIALQKLNDQTIKLKLLLTPVRKSIALHSSHGGSKTNEGRESPYVVHVLHVKPQTKVERPRMKSLWYNMSFITKTEAERHRMFSLLYVPSRDKGGKAYNDSSVIHIKPKQR